MSTEDADVVVVGSGAAGLSAAIVLAQGGLNVIVMEKSEHFGGTTAYSGGSLWVPNNRFMQELGVQDSLTEADKYLRSILGEFYDVEKIGAFLNTVQDMMEYFEAGSSVKFEPVATPDYEMDLEGAKTFRTVVAVPYDGRELGSYLKHLRPALPQIGIMGMQIHVTDIPKLLNVHRSPEALLYSAKLYLASLRDRIIHGRSARLTLGNALAGRLLRSALDSGVTLWPNAAVEGLVKTGGAVTGVRVRRRDQQYIVEAHRAVILASGGFGANSRMREKYIPMGGTGFSLQPGVNQGDGLRMGCEAGGVMQTENYANLIGTPVSVMLRRDKSLVVFPSSMDRHKPGSIIVNQEGRRFANETTHYQRFVKEMQLNGISVAYLIANEAFQRRYGIGMSPPAPLPFRHYVRKGYLVTAATIEELAAKLGIRPDALVDTVTRFDENALRGVDPDFHRGEGTYAAYMGDSSHKPNPGLAPVGPGPYYALRLYQGDFSTLVGLETNANAEVLDVSGAIIGGLYAVGIDMNSVFRGVYPGGGTSLGPAMTFGYIAAKHIMQRAESTDAGG